jgi:hypothetical protein
MSDHAPMLLGFVPGEFILFALVLAGIALLQRHTLEVAITGLAAVTLYKLTVNPTKMPAPTSVLILAALACGWEQRNVILIARPALGFFGASRERARHPSSCAKS